MKKSTSNFIASMFLIGAAMSLSPFLTKNPVLILPWTVLLLYFADMIFKRNANHLLEQGINGKEYQIRIKKQKKFTRILQLLVLITALILVFQIFFRK